MWVHWVYSVLKLGCDLDEIVVIEFNFFWGVEACAYVDGGVGEAEVVVSFAVEVSFDAEDLEDEGSFEACANVDDSVF